MARSCGDFVIRRADGLPAYQLAVVVDDAFQGISDVVRGSDLLESTPRQILVQKKLGLPRPGYAHLPVASNKKGTKLSKRLGSDPVGKHSPETTLTLALEFLGQPAPPGGSIVEILEWASAHWQIGNVPRTREILLEPEDP